MASTLATASPSRSGAESSAASSISSSDFPALPFSRIRSAASTASCRSDSPWLTLISALFRLGQELLVGHARGFPTLRGGVFFDIMAA